MTSLSIDQIKAALIGLEHSGKTSTIYQATLAVENKILGITRENNSSGISFGLSQLDIGNNKNAQLAYAEILNEALDRSIISTTIYNHLLGYNGVQRPDLDKNLFPVLRNDIKFLNKNIFAKDFAKSIVDKYDNFYIEKSVQKQVNDFLNVINSKWSDPNRPGPETVFDPTHPDFGTAVSAIISIINRTGNAGETTEHFLQNIPDSLADVKSRYDSIAGLGDHWSAVKIGGAFIAGDNCFPPGTLIEMWPLGGDVRVEGDGCYDEGAVLGGVWKKPIEEVCVGDEVLSFDKSGEVFCGSVTRLYSNVTDHFLKLEFGDGRDAVYVTEGHHFADPAGGFTAIGEMVREGRAQIVLENGALETVLVSKIEYSSQTAHLFEEGVGILSSEAVLGNLALKPEEISGWERGL